jgi:hypothetical protein
MPSRRDRNDRPLGAVREGESRNLRALGNVIDAWLSGAASGLPAGHLPEYLASQGVLVVSSLTDDELLACDVGGDGRETPMERAEVAAAVRDRLERIARGNARTP